MFSQNGHRHYKNLTANATRCFQCMLDPFMDIRCYRVKNI